MAEESQNSLYVIVAVVIVAIWGMSLQGILDWVKLKFTNLIKEKKDVKENVTNN